MPGFLLVREASDAGVRPGRFGCAARARRAGRATDAGAVKGKRSGSRAMAALCAGRQRPDDQPSPPLTKVRKTRCTIHCRFFVDSCGTQACWQRRAVLHELEQSAKQLAPPVRIAAFRGRSFCGSPICLGWCRRGSGPHIGSRRRLIRQSSDPRCTLRDRYVLQLVTAPDASVRHERRHSCEIGD